MDLYEYQGKQYFARFGIPTSAGGVADTVDEAVAQADAAGYPVVVKAVGGGGGIGMHRRSDHAPLQSRVVDDKLNVQVLWTEATAPIGARRAPASR